MSSTNLFKHKTYACPVPNYGYYDDPVSDEDITILKSMARRVKDIAEHPVQEERRTLWKKLNSLEPCRIPVFFRILDLCWPEIFPWETTLKTKKGWTRNYEDYLFKLIWHQENLNDDFITESVVPYATAGKFGRMLMSKKYFIPGYNSGVEACKVDAVLTRPMSPETLLIDTEVAVDQEETGNRLTYPEEVFDGILTPQRSPPPAERGIF